MNKKNAKDRSKPTQYGSGPNNSDGKNAVDRSGSPGRTPGTAEGDRSDIEEWLKEDIDQEKRETKLERQSKQEGE